MAGARFVAPQLHDRRTPLATEIKLIALDLDGTLVPKSHDIPERNRQAVQRACAQGVTVVIATGRMHRSACQFVQRLGLEGTPIISYNGAMVRLPEGEKPLMHTPLAADLAAEIVARAVSEGHHLNYYLDDVLYVTHIEHWARLYQQRTGDLGQPVGDLRQFAGQVPTKLLLTTHPQEIEALLPVEQERYEGRAYVTRSMPEYLEYLSLEASKGRALEWLAGYLGVGREQIMACGDMLNDLPMIEWAGVGVAMAGAQEAVREAADFVPVDPEAGVAEAIEKYIG
jgi:hypothetical protein